MAKNDGKKDWSEIMGSSSSTSHLPKRADAARARSAASANAASRSAGAKRSGASVERRPSKKARKGRLGKRIGLGLVFAFLALLIAGLSAFLLMYTRLSVPAASDLALAQKSTIYYADGATEMGSLGETDREIIDATTLPDYVGKAVVASEDRTFYTNSGVDLKGILRALVKNVTTGTRQGGSTLTQQYVERYYVGETTSYAGKAKEAVLAIKINREQSKDQILGNYLNTIYFGRGAYGIEAASKAYFGHGAKDLTLSESAMLAGIIPAPSTWDPAEDPDQAKTRWARVLNLMVEDGWISQSDADAAAFPETIDPASLQKETMAGPNGYLIEQIRSEILTSGAIDEQQLANGGLRIVSTIDKTRQDAAVAAAQTMDSVEGWNPSTMHVALSSVDPATGEIVAEYAGADYLERQQNAVTQDIAMAGSSFKPFALLANAKAGGSVRDKYSGKSPQSFDGLPSKVENDGGYSFGTVDLVKATAYSINTAFVALNDDIGPAATMQAAIDAGIPESTAGLDSTLLNVLGFASPHNIDLATAYSTIASGGEKTTAHIVRSVADSHGNPLYTVPTTKERAFSVEDVSSIMPALEAVTASDGTAEDVSRALPGFASGGKTGTAQEQRAAQFVGFVPGLVTAVSMYQSDESGNSVPLTNIGGLDEFHGGDWPVDVWNSYMKVATQTLSATHFDWVTKSSRTARNTVQEPQSALAPSQQQAGQNADEASRPQAPAQQAPAPSAPDTGSTADQNAPANGSTTNPPAGGTTGAGNGTGSTDAGRPGQDSSGTAPNGNGAGANTGSTGGTGAGAASTN